MSITSILFDADGVIQRPTALRRSLWADLLRNTDVSIDAFLQEAFAAERTCYTGNGNITQCFTELLERWNCSGDLATALAAWTAIELDGKVVDIIAALRASGCRCYLASNQEPYRAHYMSETLGYRALVDAEFYSCAIGYAKPDAAYFTKILKTIDVPAGEVLFIDDHRQNVEAAQSVGLHASVFAPAPDESWHDHMRGVLAGHGL